jgi:hypothetical protein
LFNLKSNSYPKQQFENALECLRAQTGVLERVTEDMTRHAGHKILTSAGPIAVAAESSCKSVVLLVEHDQIRDAFVCARTALLSIINAGFILAEGEEVANRAQRHAIQKSVRDLDRLIEAGAIKFAIHWSGTDELKKKFPELESLLGEFTSAKGREITKWTVESEFQKIASIARKYGEGVGSYLLIGMAVIYRHGSEIAHGTLFGESWHLGFTTPGDYPHDIEQINLGPRKRATTMLAVLGFCVFALIDVLSREFGDLRSLFLESDVLMKRFVSTVRTEA